MGYEVLWEPRGVVKRFHGHVSREDMLEPVIRIAADMRFDTLRYVINDLLDVRSIDFTAADVTEIAALDMAGSLSNPRIVVAVVATLPAILELVPVYAEPGTHGFPTACFATVAEARHWVATVPRSGPPSNFGALPPV